MGNILNWPPVAEYLDTPHDVHGSPSRISGSAIVHTHPSTTCLSLHPVFQLESKNPVLYIPT